jgi:hypothetical protein
MKTQKSSCKTKTLCMPFFLQSQLTLLLQLHITQTCNHK